MKRIKLNAIQYKFWMDHQLKYPSNEYNDTNFTFMVTGNLRLDNLKKTLFNVILEYPPFYSHIRVEQDVPYFCPDEDFGDVPFVVQRVAPAGGVDEAIAALVARPFDLSKEYPCRFYALDDGDRYYLVFLFHHVVMDGFSFPLFFDRLSAVYNALLADSYQPHDQRDELIAFNTDFGRQYEAGKQKNVDYWQQYIADTPMLLSIPHLTDTESEAQAYHFALGHEVYSRVEQFCSQWHTSPFRLYASVWALSLARVARADEILLDHALNLRPADNDTLFGVFVNNLPMKYSFADGNRTFRELLEQVHADRRQLRQHQYAFYQDILKNNSGSVGPGNIVNVAINYPVRLNSMYLTLDGCKSLGYKHVEVHPVIDLNLLIEDDKAVNCTLRHKSHFSTDFVKSLGITFSEILGQVLDDVDVRLKDIHLLPQDMQLTLAEEQTQKVSMAEPPQTFLPRFHRMVEAYGQHPAVEDNDGQLTYSELDTMSTRVAAFLQQQGWCRQRIALSTPKNVYMLVAVMGIMKSGNAYVPLDYELPADRLRFMIDDCQIAAVLTTHATPISFGTLPAFQVEDILQSAAGELSASVLPTDEAYVIYTSGTTGRPKAIPIQHSMLNQLIVNHLNFGLYHHELRVAQFLNICFDASIFDIFPVLNAGGTLVLPRDIERKDPQLFLSFLEEKRISMTCIPPALLATLPHRPLPDLQTIIVGGDSTPASAIAYWSQGRHLLNAYGPSENTVDTTYTLLNADSQPNDIGPAAPGVSCYVMDSCGHLVPDNTLGELYIGGVKLTTGYIHRPELNEKKFVPNPYTSDEDRKRGRNTILYKTGDLVMRRPDGHLLFIGREDFQVKLNGFRIELGDIESQTMAYGHGIRNAMAMMHRQDQLKQLVMYVVTESPADFDAGALRAYLRQHLPAYMVPAVIIPLEDFPYNTSGKVDRKRLPDPSQYQESEREIIPPVTPTEERLAQLWQQLLPGQLFGRDDDFTALGGDSLAVIQLSFHIEETFQVSVRASDIYQHSTLSALAAQIDQLLEVPAEPLVTDPQWEEDAHLPLSPAQMNLWLQCAQSDELNEVYNVPCLFECPAGTEMKGLQEAFSSIIKQQDSLRMSFPIGDDHKPYIHITPYQPIALACEEVTDEELYLRLADDLQVKFDLESGPLYCIHTYKVDSQKLFCSLVMHHLISDGWSAEYIQRLVHQYLRGEMAEGLQSGGNYANYVRQSRQLEASSDYQQRLDYWNQQLDDISDLQLFGTVHTPHQGIRGACLNFILPQATVRQVEAFCHTYNLTPFEVYCSTWLLFLSRWSRQTDFAIGFPYLGREEGKYQNVVGFFVHTLPLCYKAAYNDLTFHDYVQAIHTQLIEAERHAVAYDKLVSLARQRSGQPGMQLVRSMFTMGADQPFYQYLTAEYVSFPAVMTLLTAGPQVTCRMEYQLAYLDADEVKIWYESFATLLAASTADAFRPVSDYSLASEAYVQSVIAANTCSEGLSLSAPHFVERFAAVVRRLPDKVALLSGDESLTYGQLDAASGQIAMAIRSAGIPAASSIAVNMSASLQSLTAIIGILKAGCCYVPVDESLPDERRRFILDDARCALCFTTSNYPQGEVLPSHPDAASFQNVAYIIYTSGTTGQPKGVPVSHDALAHLLDVLPPVSQMTSDSRVLLFSSISFDASVTQVFTSLSLGATLVIASPLERKDPLLLSDLIMRRHISYIEVPAAILPLLPRYDYAQLRTVVVGGDSCAESVLQWWASGRRVINAYGPTENTVDTSLCEVGPDFEPNDIGLPLPGVSCYVLDENRHIVPPNMGGELYMGGLQLTGGYLHRPELNSSKFIPNPFVSPADAARGVNTILYRSGDLVKRRTDGHLIFVGRADFQVKLHGYRIELGEIETLIARFGAVVKGVCILLSETAARQQLVAYVQADRPDDFPVGQLRQYLQSQLPPYMVPSVVIPLQEFPRNNNGKLDRRQLPDPAQYVGAEVATTPLQTDTEKRLGLLWQTYLPGQVFGRDDDFISLGGDSLAIIQMALAIQKEWSIRISAADIYQHLQLSVLAEWIDGLVAGNEASVPESECETSVPESESWADVQLDHMPLSPHQLSLWLQCVQSDAMKDAYNLPCFFACPEGTTPETFIRAFNHLVESQESFRMAFPIDTDGQPYIALSDNEAPDVSVQNIAATQLTAVLNQDLKVSFNLSEAPLYRLHLYHVDGQYYYCSLVMHHLVSDGWSAQLIMQLMRAALSGETVRWEDYRGSYTDYARRSFLFKRTDAYRRRQDYWQHSMSGISDLEVLKPKKGRAGCASGASYTCPFPEGLDAAVKTFCRNNACTPFHCYSFVYLLLLSRLSGQADFAVAFPYLGREKDEYHSIVGYFVNILPLCYRHDYARLTFLTYLDTLSSQLVETERNAISLDEIVQIQRRANDDQSRQLVQSLFTYEQSELVYDALQASHADFSLTFSVAYSDAGCRCSLGYLQSCFNEGEIRSWVETYFALLQAVVAQPDLQLEAYPLLSTDRSAVLLQHEVCHPVVGHAPQPFLDRFAQTVQTYPDKEAIVFRNESVTYAQLDRASDAICRRILQAGVEAPASVAVNMVASIHSMAVILGILKAHCSYVPIDVSLPDERRDFILKDAACTMTFTEQNYPQGELLSDGASRNASLQDIAYIIYTSGTTGIPKGVPISLSAMGYLAETVRCDYEVEPDSRVLLFASISFDVSVADIFSTFAVGATMVIAAPEERKDPNLLVDLLERQQVNCASIAPAMLVVMPRRPLPLLKVMVVAGESPVYSALMYWAKGRKMINAYGPTESTVYTTRCVVEDDYEDNDIGLPLPGVTCYVLDKNMHLVPDNLKGELYIGGLQLTEGYLNRPELNAEKFIPNPFVQPEDEARGLNTMLYKCGDVVKRRPDGHIIFVGRTDRQVKLRGFRIELSEIENHLAQCPGVKRAVVQLRKYEGQDEIVAYVQTGGETDARQLQEALRSKMPAYMVPTKWAVLHDFPLTVNGKTDWRRMPEPEVVMGEELVQPATDDERLLLEAACRIMGTEALGVETDLFDAGMTSIQVMEFVMEVCDASSHFRFNISSVYRNRTIRRILHQHGSKLYFWLDTYQPDKPVMVLVCGLPYVNYYDNFVALFRQKFNIFVFESYSEFFRHHPGVSIQALLDHYMQLAHAVLSDKTISLVTGYCVGSEIGIRLAQRLRQAGWDAPRLLMMEAFYNRPKGLPVPHVTDIELLQHQYEISQQLFDTFEPVHYDGDLLLVFSGQLSHRIYLDAGDETDKALVAKLHEEILASRAEWRREYPQAPYLEVDATHWTFFEDKPLHQIWHFMQEKWGME